MNSDKHDISAKQRRQSGNAMIYILISLALIAALTVLLTRESDNGGDDLSADQAELMTTKAVAYAGSVKTAVDQMIMGGTNVNSIDFSTPTSANYDAETVVAHRFKVFHPEGGGVTLNTADTDLFTALSTTIPAPGWYLEKFNNVGWTPTASNDIVLSAYGISSAVCANINKKITGSTSIPVISASDISVYFVKGGSNANLTTGECNACMGYPSMCVVNTPASASDPSIYVYYNVIEGL